MAGSGSVANSSVRACSGVSFTAETTYFTATLSPPPPSCRPCFLQESHR